MYDRDCHIIQTLKHECDRLAEDNALKTQALLIQAKELMSLDVWIKEKDARIAALEAEIKILRESKDDT